MNIRFSDRLSGLSTRRMRLHWARLADSVSDIEASELRHLRGRARGIRKQVDQFLYRAEEKLSLPMSDVPVLDQPLHSDWKWRPSLWSGPLPDCAAAEIPRRFDLGPDATLYHDCDRSEITARQVRNTASAIAAPFGLALDIFGFEGSFLSLVVELPQESLKSLGRRHIIGTSLCFDAERPLEVFARLNVQHGPNTEQVVREIPAGTEDPSVEFDLAYAEINEKRIEKAWIDLIFEGPEMNAITVQDVTLARWPRAEM